MKTRPQPEPEALRAAIKSAETWVREEEEYSCCSSYYRSEWSDRPRTKFELDRDYGSPEVAYWAVASGKHREALIDYYPLHYRKDADYASYFLKKLADEEDYADLIDNKDLSFLNLWRAHLPTTEDED